jgi:hypothetical protein
MQEEVLTKGAKEMFESLIPRGKMGRSEEIATVAGAGSFHQIATARALATRRRTLERAA